MLTAYNYYEPEEENRVRKNLKDSALFERELSLAERYSGCHPSGTVFRESCPMCGSASVHPFYEKWGVRYVRCGSCASVFADVSQEAAENFRGMEARRALRLSETYQAEAAAARSMMWQETLDWLRFRTYRYLGRNGGLAVCDAGCRWRGFRDMLLASGLCGSYQAFDSILDDAGGIPVPGPCSTDGSGTFFDDRPCSTAGDCGTDGGADIMLALDYMQQLHSPDGLLALAGEHLKKGGLLVISTRLGTGLDTLLLKEKNRNVFPYEHILLPSREGIRAMLEKAGFEVLEFTTPGTFDVNYIKANLDAVSGTAEFVHYFLSRSTPELEAEFQRFIQKAGLSSHAQVIARKTA